MLTLLLMFVLLFVIGYIVFYALISLGIIILATPTILEVIWGLIKKTKYFLSITAVVIISTAVLYHYLGDTSTTFIPLVIYLMFVVPISAVIGIIRIVRHLQHPSPKV